MNTFDSRMDLQMFADPNTFFAGASTMHGTQDNGTVAAGLTAEMKTFYSKELIELVGPNLVYAQFGDKVSIGRGKGREIEWRKFGKFSKALKPLTEGVTPIASTLTLETVTKKLEQFGDWSIVTDVLDLTAIDPVIVEITERHAQNASLTMDTIVRNDLITGTNVLYADTVNASTGAKTENSLRSTLSADSKMTADTVAQAVRIMKNRNAPKIDGSYIMIIHPSVSYDLMRNPEWIDVNKYTNATAIFNGEIGKLYGVRFIETTECPVFKGGQFTTTSTSVSQLTTLTYDADTKTITFRSSTITGNYTGKQIVLEWTKEGATTVTEYAIIQSNAGLGTGGTGGTLTLVNPLKGPPEEGYSLTTIKGSGGGASGRAVYGCLLLGKGAYKVADLDGNNAEIIVKSASNSDTSDPLNQRNTIGWKINGYGAAIVVEDYILRVECCSSFDDDAN